METIIRKKLADIEKRENVEIILAAEAGVRAWGLGSPNSDHCVRFIYKRKRNDYLRLDPMKDTIEWQLGNTLDIVGWDLKKVLQLLNASNPALFELFDSPIVYQSGEMLEDLKKLAANYYSPKKSLLYYWHTASSNYTEYLNAERVRVRDYFYVLRPLLAGTWILDKNCPPPVDFMKLLDTEFPAQLRRRVDKLLKLKKEYSELNYALKIVSLNKYIDEQLSKLKQEAEKVENQSFAWDDLNQFFLEKINH